MTFVFPILLGGLVFAGLPVLLHFLIRQKPKTLLFPAFRFLMQKQRSNTRNLRLRHLLLMLLRIALIVLLCFALSRPRILSDAFGISGEKPLAMVLVFDTSPSMDYKRGETSRLDLVKKRALELLEPLFEDCRIMILDSGDTATFGREDFVSLDKARQRIQNLAIRPNSGPVNRAIDEAIRRFQRWEEPAAQNYPKFVCVFSDRTKASWDSSINIARSDEIKTLYFDVGVDDPIDVAITQIEFANGRQSFTEGESIALHVVVKATGNANSVESALNVVVNPNSWKKVTPFSIGKDQQETVTVRMEATEHKLDIGFHQVEVQVGSTTDALAFNNVRFATFEIRKKPRVLVLMDDLKKIQQLTEKLELLLCDVVRKTPSEKVDLFDYEAIFLLGVAAPDEKLWQALTAFVERGGGVAVIPGGAEMNLKAYHSDAAQKLLPTRLVAAVKPKDGAAWALEEDPFLHPFMRPFLGWMQQTEINFLKHKRVAYQYWSLEPFKNPQDCDVVIRYEGPERHPAIVERRFAKSNGKVLLLTTPLDEREPAWNNYGQTLTSFYITLTWLTARHLVAESARANRNHVFGGAMPIVRAQPGLPKAVLRYQDADEEIQFDEKTNEWRGDRLARDGNYKVRASNPDRQQSKDIASFSVNIPNEESDLTRLPKEQIEAALGKDSLIPQDQHTPLLKTIAPYWEEPVELFPFLMLVLLLLFALENLIANKFYRQEPPSVMNPADLNLAFEPAWPWSIPFVGPIAFVGVAVFLIALTVWTYRGVAQANGRRIGLVIALRLAALALTLCVLLRPSFAMTQLDGVEGTKLLVIVDRSKSMNVADVEGKSTRWDHVKQLWESREVQRRLEQLAAEQQIEIVKYHAAEDLRPYEANAEPSGKRTDMGNWLHQLWQKHGHEKRLRGVVMIGDGGDNGTKFSLQEKARSWRGVAPIHTFGVGNPNDPRFKRDIALTSLRVANDKPIPVKSKFAINAIVQAPGFDKAAVNVSVTMVSVDPTSKEPHKAAVVPAFRITQEKDQRIDIQGDAPDIVGEYKLTMRIEPQAGEANPDNNEISTFVQVMKEKIHVLWVDRPRVYEPTFAIRAIKSDERFEVHYALPSLKDATDPFAFYQMATIPYDVIVIGDISAQEFCLGKSEFFKTIYQRITEKKTGLLMLGGSETFAKGGWAKETLFMSMLPVDFAPKKAAFVQSKVHLEPTTGGESYAFLRLHSDKANNIEFWKETFNPVNGYAPMGKADAQSSILLKADDGENMLVAKRYLGSHVAVFAADSTSKAWRGSKEAISGYEQFWRQLAYWLAGQQDQNNELWVSLDKRRINLDIDESLGFTFGMRDKAGKEIANAKFDVKVLSGEREFPVRHSMIDKQHRGTFQGAHEPGEYRVEIKSDAPSDRAIARFFVVSEDIEMLRPVADHETLKHIAEASDGRFHPAQEQALLDYLDELRTQVNTESRHKTTHWPDWKRLPASDGTRDQLAGVWGSFSLVAFLLFVLLLGSEWLMRRKWGMV